MYCGFVMQSRSSHQGWCCAGELSCADCHANLQPAHLLSCADCQANLQPAQLLSRADYHAQLHYSRWQGQRLRQHPLIHIQQQRLWQWWQQRGIFYIHFCIQLRFILWQHVRKSLRIGAALWQLLARLAGRETAAVLTES